MAETRISRATLNNYVKKGILPAPVVRTPASRPGKTKRIGYFPCTALDRVREIHALKRAGKSMAQICEQFRGVAMSQDTVGSRFSTSATRIQDHPSFCTEETGVIPKLCINVGYTPAYLLDHNFQLLWVNASAQKDIFHQEVNWIETRKYISIFRILFDWRFHENLKNWRDLMALHIRFVKMKYAKNWFDDLYKGISKSEILLLKEIYEKVRPVSKVPVHKTHFQFLTDRIISKSCCIFTLLCAEGFFFLYIPQACIQGEERDDECHHLYAADNACLGHRR